MALSVRVKFLAVLCILFDISICICLKSFCFSQTCVCFITKWRRIESELPTNNVICSNYCEDLFSSIPGWMVAQPVCRHIQPPGLSSMSIPSEAWELPGSQSALPSDLAGPNICPTAPFRHQVQTLPANPTFPTFEHLWPSLPSLDLNNNPTQLFLWVAVLLLHAVSTCLLLYVNPIWGGGLETYCMRADVYNTCAQVSYTPARRCLWHLRANPVTRVSDMSGGRVDLINKLLPPSRRWQVYDCGNRNDLMYAS